MHVDPGILIPIFALSIPMVAIIGRHIVRPLADALSRAPTAGEGTANGETRRELEELRDRLATLEKTLARVAEEQAFQRALQTGEKLGDPDDLTFLAGEPRLPLQFQEREPRRK